MGCGEPLALTTNAVKGGLLLAITKRRLKHIPLIDKIPALFMALALLVVIRWFLPAGIERQRDTSKQGCRVIH
jgi:hypothetical protein